MVERIPPQDLDAEMACLGSMMMCRAVIDDVADVLPGAHAFYLPAHIALYGVILDMHRQGDERAIDLVDVTAELNKRQLLETVGGQEYMVQLAESCADWANAPHYARLVVDNYRRRELIRLAGQMRNAAYAVGEDVDEVAARFAHDVEQVGLMRGGRTDAADIVDVLAELPGKKHLYVPTGLQVFDQNIGGYERSALTIIAARPSVGKTALALFSAVEAVKAGEVVLFISVEMQRDLLARRLLSMMGSRSSYEIQDRMTSEDLRNLCGHVSGQLGKGRLFIADNVTGIQDIVALGRAYVRRHKATLLVVDYLQLVKPSGKHESRTREVGAMSKELKRLAKVTGAAVVVPAQLNRCAANTKPTLATLRDSGEIEEDADVVLMLWRDDERPEKPMLCIVAKNRNGPTTQFGLNYDRRSQRFSPLAVGPIPESTGVCTEAVR